MQQDTSRIFLNAKFFGNLPIAHIIQIPQAENLCLLLRQLSQCFSQLNGELLRLQLLGWPGIYTRHGGQIRFICAKPRFAESPAQQVYRPGGGQPNQQGWKVAHALPL